MNKVELHYSQKRYSTRRHGGLYFKGNLVKYKDLIRSAKKMDVEVPDLHKKLIEISKTEQIISQKMMTRKEIFKKINDSIQKVNIPHGRGRGFSQPLLTEALLKAFDDNELMVSSNSRRSFLMPCIDEHERLTRQELTKVFACFIEAAGLTKELGEHGPSNLMDAFIAQILV